VRRADAVKWLVGIAVVCAALVAYTARVLHEAVQGPWTTT
jgi:hypothetical protein